MGKTLKQTCDEANVLLSQLAEQRTVFVKAVQQLRTETDIISYFLKAFSEVVIYEEGVFKNKKISTERTQIYGQGMVDLIKQEKITAEFIKNNLEARVPEKFSVTIKFRASQRYGEKEEAVITVSLI